MSFKVPEKPSAELDEGVLADYEGSQFRIAYATNVKFMRAKQRLEQPHRRKIEAGTLDPGEHRRIMAKAMAEGILVGWSGVFSEGAEVPYTVKMAEQALLYDESFREFVMTFSMDLANFRTEEREYEGNS